MSRTLMALVALLLLPAGALAARPADGDGLDWVTILHNNDAESDLVDAGSGLEDFGGAHRFAARLAEERRAAVQRQARGDQLGPPQVLLLSSGDNFLAGPEFNASLEQGVPFYDSIALDSFGYDAIAIGNHEFDFGPDVLADFIEGFRRPVSFLSANLDLSGEPRLAALEAEGRIAPWRVVRRGNDRYGIVGATTPSLPNISSPRKVVVEEVLPAVQGAIDAMGAMGVDRIILISHLQGIDEDLALLPQLRGVDIAIAGGGDELLANPVDRLLPGDEGEVFGGYPLWATNADGALVPVVTTSGGYRYLGRLVVAFDDAGNLVQVDEGLSGPLRIAGGEQADAVRGDPALEKRVVEPVREALAALGSRVIATSEVALDGLRSNVRTRETNEGNLIADALLWQASTLAASFDAPAPDFSMQNGGGIRNNTVIAAGSLTELDTFDMLPFGNFVSIVEDLPRAQVKEILENAVSAVEFTSGRFAQLGGATLVYDPAGTAQQLDDDEQVLVPGDRVVDFVLADGTAIVQGGQVVAGPALAVATIDFLARGGDQYPFRGASFTSVGISYQQALENYLVGPLAGLVSAADYPEGGEGRIDTVGSGATLELAVRAGGLRMLANHPNPFNPSTTIRFALPAAGPFELRVLDLRGRLVRSFSGRGSAGVNQLHWDGRGNGGATVASGVYHAKIRAAGQEASTRMILSK